MKKPQIKYYSIAIVVLASMLISSCKTKLSTNELPMGEWVIFEVLLEGPQGNISTKQNTLITSQKMLEEVLEGINSTQDPGADIPELDFSNYQVGLASMGEKTSGGYSITIESIEKTPKNIIINVVEESPAPGDAVTSVMTSPFVLFKFEKQSLPVEFKYADAIK